MIEDFNKILYLLPAIDKFKLCILFVMMLFAAVIEVIGIGMIPVFISILASPDKILSLDWLSPYLQFIGINSGEDLLLYGSILLIIVFIIKSAYLIFYKYIQSKFIWGRFSLIGSQLFERYMKAPYEFHLNRNSSELLRNVTQETQYLATFVITPTLVLLMDIVLILSIFALLFATEPIITLGVIVILGGGGSIFLKIIRSKTQKYGKSGQVDRAEMIRSVNEGLGGLKDAQILNRENWFINSFKKNIYNYGKSQAYREVASSSSKPVIETIAVIGMVLIALTLFWQGRGLEAIIPILTLFGAATVRLMPAIKESVKAITNLRYYNYCIHPLFNDTVSLNKINKKKNFNLSEKSKEIDIVLKKEIIIENLCYAYPEAFNPALQSLSINIKKGSSIGFVGESGSGKSTLINLLLGLLEPSDGCITVDEINIHENIKSWQKNIGYIPQFIFLSDDTIKRNIAFGLDKNEIDNSMLEKAIIDSQLSKFIDSLPEGVHTKIGEDGTRLSGGQRQRIGIARALYHQPKVLILDEATSALDNVTESQVIKAIEKLKNDRTIIMIAHRMSTIKNCDNIFLLQDGSLISSGTYKQLLNKSKNFKKMT